MANDASADDVAYVTALVRAHDLPRYYAALFAPREARDALLAIYGFAAEIARVPNQVREPTLGAIRLKWWSEALAEAVRRDGAGETPALRAAAGAIVRHALPLAAFEALIEARSADLYSDPPATLTDLEGRMGETESALFQMAAIVLGAAGTDTADAAGHAGVTYGIARGLRDVRAGAGARPHNPTRRCPCSVRPCSDGDLCFNPARRASRRSRATDGSRARTPRARKSAGRGA